MAKLATSGYIRELIVIAPSLKEQEEMVIRRTKTIEVTVWVTSDGREFDSEHDAKIHEGILRGQLKYCDLCQGNGQMTRVTDLPILGEYYFEGVCDKCDGIGIVIIEDIK